MVRSVLLASWCLVASLLVAGSAEAMAARHWPQPPAWWLRQAACITYHESSIKNPMTNRWNKGPIVKRVTIYVVVETQVITLSTIEKDVT